VTLDEFETTLLRLGARIETWPEPLRDAALALLRDGPAAQALLDELARIEQAVRDLDGEMIVVPRSTQDITATVQQRDRAERRRSRWMTGALLGSGAVFCGAAGALVGAFIVVGLLGNRIYGTASLDLMLFSGLGG